MSAPAPLFIRREGRYSHKPALWRLEGKGQGVMLRLTLGGLAFVAHAGAALAQQSASPGNVYDCTALTDPAQVRQCINRNAGVGESGQTAGGRPLLEDRGAADQGAGPPP